MRSSACPTHLVSILLIQQDLLTTKSVMSLRLPAENEIALSHRNRRGNFWIQRAPDDFFFLPSPACGRGKGEGSASAQHDNSSALKSFDLSVLRRGAHRAHDIDVARAHAKITAEADAYFFVTRIGII